MFDTLYLSLNPELNAADSETLEDTLDELGRKPEWLAWRQQPSLVNASMSWSIEDRSTTRLTRAKQGGNLLISVEELLDASAQGQLRSWVIDHAHLFAAHLTDLLDLKPSPSPPERVSRTVLQPRDGPR